MKIAFIEYITVVLDTLYNSKVFHLLIASDMLRLCRSCPFRLLAGIYLFCLYINSMRLKNNLLGILTGVMHNLAALTEQGSAHSSVKEGPTFECSTSFDYFAFKEAQDGSFYIDLFHGLYCPSCKNRSGDKDPEWYVSNLTDYRLYAIVIYEQITSWGVMIRQFSLPQSASKFHILYHSNANHHQ